MKVDIHEDGLLWLINRVVFHPRGYALSHQPGTDEWALLGNGTETWRFDPNEMDDAGFARAEMTLDRAAKEND